jgi:hypothetical protein
MTATIRDQIMDAIQETLATISTSAPVGDPYDQAFSAVVQGSPDNIVAGKKNVAAIYDGSEIKSYKSYPAVNCTLTVDVEVYAHVSANENGLKRIRGLVGVVERRLGEDKTLGGLCHDVLVVAVDAEETGVYDTYAQGVVRLNVTYKHLTTDPRSPAYG